MLEEIEYELLDKKMKDSNVFYHEGIEDIRGFLSGKTSNEVRDIEKRISKCSCGGNVEIHEFNCMGDGSYTIICKKCGRNLERSQYDCDITKWEDVLEFTIRDWNNGLCSDDIKEKNEQELLKRRLTNDDFVWKELYPNNMPGNGLNGYYTLLFKRDGDKIFAIKWTIEFQYKEIKPMFISHEIESYNLYMKRYFDLEKTFSYPTPNDDFDIMYENDFSIDGVNDFGDFERNYKSLEEAKLGALSRCGFYGVNKYTLLKN